MHPVGCHNHSLTLYNLSRSLILRFQKFNDMQDLDETITHNQVALGSFTQNNPGCYSTCRNLLGAALWIHFERVGNMYDLNGAVVNIQGAVATLSPIDPGYAICRDNPVVALMTRFE